MTGALVGLAIAVALSIPMLWIARSDRRLTWTTAVIVGTVLSAIALILLGDVPSRLLYVFDEQGDQWAAQYPGVLGWLENERLLVTFRDIVVNTVQIVFFVILVAAAYIWGQRQAKAGRFK